MKFGLTISALAFAPGCIAFDEPVGDSANGLGALRWSASVGSSGNDSANAIAVDSAGDVIAGGSFTAPMDFGQGTVDPTGDDGAGAYLTKRDGDDGAVVWTRALLGGYAEIWDLAVDRDDNILVFGDYFAPVDFGGVILTQPDGAPLDSFVASYDRDGELRWVRGLGPSSDSWSYGVAADGAGNVYAVGHFRGTLDLGDGPIAANPGGTSDWYGALDWFLVSYDRDGARRWGFAAPAEDGQSARSITVAPDGDVIVAGSFRGSASFGGAPLTADAYTRGFITRFGADGTHRWSRAVGPTGANAATSGLRLATDAAGHIYGASVDSGDRTTGNGDDPTVLRAFDADGNDLWSAYSMRGTGAGLATTPDGLLVTGGSADGALVLAAHALDGVRLETTSYSSGGIRDLATAPTGAIAVLGIFDSSLDFGDGAHASNGGRDLAIAVFDSPQEAP